MEIACSLACPAPTSARHVRRLACPCRPPLIFSADSTVADAGTACLIEPKSGGPYTGFNCTVCRGSDCTQAPTCSNNNRRRSLLDGGCNVNTRTCQLPGLESTTLFR